MDGIYETNESFDFNKITLLSPVNIPGGNYFIKFRINDSPLYIHPPKCKTRQSFLKSGKKIYCDLMFSNEDEKFIQWMEKLEIYCQTILFENRKKWFDIELDEHDIENSFTSPLKIFKSGKYYISRTNVPTKLDICSLKIFNEEEEEVNIEDIQENTDVKTILEIQGIKCSTKNFQVEVELKQMMVLKKNNIFEKCLLNTSYSNSVDVLSKKEAAALVTQNLLDQLKKSAPLDTTHLVDSNHSMSNSGVVDKTITSDYVDDSSSKRSEKTTDTKSELLEKTIKTNQESFDNISPIIEPKTEVSKVNENQVNDPIKENPKNKLIHDNPSEFSSSDRIDGAEGVANPTNSESLPKNLDNNQTDILEIDFDLEKLTETDTVHIKKRNYIYYEMYKQAKRKAKISKDLAISSYLEAKYIKNTYLIEEFEDSESDLEEAFYENNL